MNEIPENLNCPVPTPIASNPTEFQKLQAMGARQTYILCRIQSAQKVMEALAIELSKESVDAGVHCRNMVRQFREMEMTFLSDSRHALKLQGDKITDEDMKQLLSGND